MDWRTVVIAISKFRLETGVRDAMENGARIVGYFILL